MSSSPSHNSPGNAIERMLEQMEVLWAEFMSDRHANTAIWCTAHDEAALVKGFVDRESGESGETDDIFFSMESDFDEYYDLSLIEEIVGFASAAADVEDAAEYMEGFVPDIEEKKTYDTFDLILLIEQLRKHLDLDEASIILFLDPRTGKNAKKWVKWVETAIALLPPTIRFVISQTDDAPVFNTLAQRLPLEVTQLRPEIDIPAAITQLSAQGKADEPDTRFRAIYVAMMQAGEKGELDEMESLGEKALGITERNKWPLMAAAIHMLRGGVYVNLKKKDKGDRAYDEAIDILEAAVDKKVEMAGDQLVIALFSKGMVKMLQKRHEEASDIYRYAAEQAALTDNRYLTMDAWRMCGHCLARIKKVEEAIDCHHKAIGAAQGLEQDVLRGSTLPDAGAELMRLSAGEDKIVADEKMKALVGEDWESLVQKGKKIKKGK